MPARIRSRPEQWTPAAQWSVYLTEPKNRDVAAIFIVCTDRVEGIVEAVGRILDLKIR